MLNTLFSLLRQYFRHQRYLRICDSLCVESLVGFILDLGGGPASFFAAFFPRPQQIILVDIDRSSAYEARRKYADLHVIVADGAHLPLADRAMEITICNSVIEHVESPGALAAEICRVSQGFFLQTPNGSFPLETHSFVAMPFYNVIPWTWLQRLACNVFGANYGYVSSVRYLTDAQLRHLFPRATLAYEQVFGMKKSFYVSQVNRNAQ